MQAGAPFGIAPYGTEALGVMRIEKGHVAGNEIDGRTTGQDLGLGRMMSKKKDFIGKVLAQRPALCGRRTGHSSSASGRATRAQRLNAGAHVLPAGAAHTAEQRPGRHYLGRLFALVEHLDRPRPAGARPGAYRRDACTMVDPVRDNVVEMEVCSPVFVDPKGERLRV